MLVYVERELDIEYVPLEPEEDTHSVEVWRATVFRPYRLRGRAVENVTLEDEDAAMREMR